jgi:hypothetical protein
MPNAICLAFLNDLAAIGWDRLKACPLKDDKGRQCGKIFLSKRRQLYCRLAHAQLAASARFFQRKMKLIEKERTLR